MVKLRVNGQEQSFDGDPSMPLLWYLRDELGLTGTKYGCGVALCAACTVHIDGQAARACITAISDLGGRSVTTIEGLDRDGNHPVQKAWPSICTVQAPQSAAPQPNFVPVSPNSSRKYHSSGIDGSPSNDCS